MKNVQVIVGDGSRLCARKRIIKTDKRLNLADVLLQVWFVCSGFNLKPVVVALWCSFSWDIYRLLADLLLRHNVEGLFIAQEPVNGQVKEYL